MPVNKVLAVDDESDILLIVRAALQSEGIEVATASNGEDGLATAAEFMPDVIILDVMMPAMDGFEVVERLRANDKTRDIPVVMLTGVSERGRVKNALDSGVSHYLVKPFEIHELLSTVERAAEDDGLDISF